MLLTVLLFGLAEVWRVGCTIHLGVETGAVYAIRVRKVVHIPRILLNVLPATLLPSAGHQVHLFWLCSGSCLFHHIHTGLFDWRTLFHFNFYLAGSILVLEIKFDKSFRVWPWAPLLLLRLGSEMMVLNCLTLLLVSALAS